MKVVPLIILVSFLSSIQAQSILTVRCEPPVGMRIDYGVLDISNPKEYELQTGEDSYTGVGPVFLVDEQNPEQMTVIWGASHLVADESRTGETKKVPIVSRSPDQITGVESDENSVWVFSLFPKLKFGRVNGDVGRLP